MRLIGVLLIVLLMASAGWATTVVRMDLPALVQESDHIVQGHVETVYGEWDERLKVIFTYVSLRVDDPLKGDSRRTILIRQLGGKVGSMNMSIAGMPMFNPGEDVIVFLKGIPEGNYNLVGLGQGKYAISGNVAVANVSGLELLDRKTGQLIAGPAAIREPLESFKARIRSLVQ